MIVKYQSDLWDRLFCKDIINPVEAKGGGNILLGFVFSSFSSTKPLKWCVPTFFFKLHVPALFLSLSLPLLPFTFSLYYCFSFTVVCFPLILTQTMVVLPNVLWSSGKFLECQ